MKFNTFSEVVISAVITNIDLNANTSVTNSPVAEVTVYDPIHKNWVDNIYILFSDNSNARKFRMFHVGDILMIYGELIYSSGVGYVISPTNYTILSSNKKDIPLHIQKVNLINSFGVINRVYIKGNLLSLNRNNIASISHELSKPIKGNINQISIQPVHYFNKVKNGSKNIIFLGYFGKIENENINSNLLQGDIYEILV